MDSNKLLGFFFLFGGRCISVLVALLPHSFRWVAARRRNDRMPRDVYTAVGDNYVVIKTSFPFWVTGAMCVQPLRRLDGAAPADDSAPLWPRFPVGSIEFEEGTHACILWALHSNAVYNVKLCSSDSDAHGTTYNVFRTATRTPNLWISSRCKRPEWMLSEGAPWSPHQMVTGEVDFRTTQRFREIDLQSFIFMDEHVKSPVFVNCIVAQPGDSMMTLIDWHSDFDVPHHLSQLYYDALFTLPMENKSLVFLPNGRRRYVLDFR